MLGQANHFRKYAKEKVPYAIERYTTEAARLFGVMERRLADRPFLAGEYSIADIACFPWVQLWPGLGVEIDDYPNIKSWLERIAARPAVKRGLEAAQNPSVVVR